MGLRLNNMSVSINWSTKIIFVSKNYMSVVQTFPTEIRQLDLNAFRLALKALEYEPDGMPYTLTHNHNPSVTVGGVQLAQVIEILEPYTITFEDGQYAVNLVGANSNVADKTNVNQVSIRSANSAGLTQIPTDAIWGRIPAGSVDTVETMLVRADKTVGDNQALILAK